MGTQPTSRRDLLKAAGTAGVTGLTLSIAGCIGDDEDTGAPVPGIPGAEELGDPVPELHLVMPTEGSNPERHDLALINAENYEELGFEVNRDQMDFETQVTVALVDHDFDINVIGWGGTPERIDPHIFIFDLHHPDHADPGGRNSPGYDNPAYNELAEAQFVETDPEERQALVYEAQEILAQDQPRTYVAAEADRHPYRNDNVENVVPTMGEGLNSFWNMITAETIGERAGEPLRFGMPTEVTSLNPMQDMATPDRQWVRLLYDRLYRINDEGVPQPWAAAAEPTFQDDGTTVVVPIRDGMTFHDGEPVTPEVVKWSFEFFGEHSVTYGGLMDHVDEVNVSGPNEVTFYLHEALATFTANVLGAIYIFPQHIWEDIDDPVDEDDETYTGSGPYQFNEWILEQELRFDAFDDHFNSPNVDRIIRVRGADVSSLVGRLEQNEIDMLGGTPSVTAQDRLEDNDDITQVTSPSIAFHKYAYNMRHEVMQDVYLRRALSHCNEKETYVEDLLGGVGEVTHSPITPVNEFWHNPDVEEYNGFDIEAAAQELADGGYGWDEDGRLHYGADFEPQMFYDE